MLPSRFFSLVLCLSIFFFMSQCRHKECPLPVVDGPNTGGNDNQGNPQDLVKTLTLQPGNDKGKDAQLYFISSQSTGKGPTNSTNYGSSVSLVGFESTFDGFPGRIASLLGFDLTTIPKNSKIVEAKLTLYGCPECGEYIGNQRGHFNYDGNVGLLQRVTSPWEEETVTWNTQPTISTANQVELSSSSAPFQDYKDINVAALVQDMVNNPGTSHGFLLSMKVRNYYRSLVFASSDHIDPAKHPKLVVKYK